MLTRWNDIDRMFGAMNLLHRNLDFFSNDFERFPGYARRVMDGETMPRTNLYDRGEAFEVRAEIPGFGTEDLKVKIQGNYLEISGNREKNTPESYKVHRAERGLYRFSRSFTLPADVDSSKAEASLENGILVLTLPKSEAAKPKQIDIK